jgi:hypothetical protein
VWLAASPMWPRSAALLGSGLDHGTDNWELPITATYVIDKKGLIVFHHVEADYRERLDPGTIVDAVAGIERG